MNLKQVLVAACVAPLAAIAFAEDAHHPDQKAKPAASKPAAKTAPGMMDMSGMQANMKRMQDQMAKIRAASDPKEHQRLMDEHMKTMHESMSMMNGMMGEGKGMGSGQRMQMMERRMDMMQMMMQQMMEHENAQSMPR